MLKSAYRKLWLWCHGDVEGHYGLKTLTRLSFVGQEDMNARALSVLGLDISGTRHGNRRLPDSLSCRAAI